jgi:hypothetical protein
MRRARASCRRLLCGTLSSATCVPDTADNLMHREQKSSRQILCCLPKSQGGSPLWPRIFHLNLAKPPKNTGKVRKHRMQRERPVAE